MMLPPLLNLVVSPALWVFKSIAIYFALIVALTSLWRAYKIHWARRGKNLRPVSGTDAILITGATSGIGLAVAKHLYKLGYSIVVGYYDSNETGYSELKQLASSRAKHQTDQKMLFIGMDVKSQASISKAYEQCTAALADNKLQLYALINNAGLGSLQPFAWLQRHTIRALIETNLLGSLLMTREFLPLLVRSKGRILNVSSGLGLVPGATYATYGITKSAQIYFTRCLNMELGSAYGIKSVAVIPHNLIKNTNICSRNVKNNEDAWSEMKPLEHQLYKQEFEQHCKLAKSLEAATREHSKLVKEKTKKAMEAKSFGAWRMISTCWEVLERLRGENAAETLEESGALECFEDALRLADPPEHIFAGDNIYNLVIGSILLSMPTSCIGLLGSAVSPSLYR